MGGVVGVLLAKKGAKAWVDVRALLRVLRVKPPFLPIGSDLKKTLFCLELEGFSGVEQEGSRGPHFPLHPLQAAC